MMTRTLLAQEQTVHMRNRKVCIKINSTEASLPLKAQLTKHLTVKQAISMASRGLSHFQNFFI